MSLFEAIELVDVTAVSAALASGADPNAVGEKGKCPLVAAVLKGSPEVVRALLAGGADVNALSHGRSALSVACAFRFVRSLREDQVATWAPAYEEITRELLARGADPKLHKGDARLAPVAAACVYGTAAQVAMLRAAGATLSLDALEEAVSSRRFALVESVLSQVPRARRTVLLQRLAQAAGGPGDAAASLARALIAARLGRTSPSMATARSAAASSQILGTTWKS